MKGRGTRKNTFEYQETGDTSEKEKFLLLDFFGNCEYFEKDFDYDEKLALPISKDGSKKFLEDPIVDTTSSSTDNVDAATQDDLITETIIHVGKEGMKIDRSLYPHQQFEQVIQESETLQKIEKEQGIEGLEEYIKSEVFNKPNEYWNAEKISSSYQKEFKVKRKISLTEMLLKALGREPKFKSREERIDEEFRKFIDIQRLEISEEQPEKAQILKTFFETYISDQNFRSIIDNGEYGQLSVYPSFNMHELQILNGAIDDVKGYASEYLHREMSEFSWDNK